MILYLARNPAAGLYISETSNCHKSRGSHCFAAAESKGTDYLLCSPFWIFSYFFSELCKIVTEFLQVSDVSLSWMCNRTKLCVRKKENNLVTLYIFIHGLMGWVFSSFCPLWKHEIPFQSLQEFEFFICFIHREKSIRITDFTMLY